MGVTDRMVSGKFGSDADFAIWSLLGNDDGDSVHKSRNNL